MEHQDCQAIFAMLSEYLDGELPPASCQDLERHIQDCPPCVEFLDSLKKSIQICREYGPSIEAPTLAPAVKASMKQAYQRLRQE